MSSAAAVDAAKEPQRTSSRRRRAERLDVDARRAQLLELGVKIVGTRRYEEPWLEEVARTADISKGLIYHYFETKRGFYVEILRHIAETLAQRWTDNITPLVERGESAQAVNRAGLNAFLDFAKAYPAAFTTLMEAGAGIDPQVKSVESYLREELIRHIAHFRGTQDLTPAQRTGVKAWAAYVERLAVEWLESDQIPRDQVLKMALAVLIATFSVSG